MNYSSNVSLSGRSSLLLLLFFYLITTLPLLTRYPAPWVDEGWIAEVAARIAGGHEPGNPSHGTVHRFHDRVFWMPPLYFLGLGGWFSIADVSLLAGRLFNVLAGAATTALLYLFVRHGYGVGPAFLAGLVFCLDTFVWKAHRTIRFESVLALFAVLLAILLRRALDRERSRQPAAAAWMLAGLAAGALVNTHPNGAFFAAAAGIETVRSGGPPLLRRKGPWLAALAGVLALVPFGLYCLSDREAGFANFIGQNSWHVDVGGDTPELLREGSRYATFFPVPWRLPAAAAALALLVAGFRRRREPGVGFLHTFLLVPLAGLAFLPNKTLLYLVPVMPFLAALAAALWKDPPGPAGAWSRRLPRVAAATLIVSGLVLNAGLLWTNRKCDPVAAFDEIRSHLRPDDRVTGTFVTWWAAWPRPFHEYSRGPTIESVDRFAPDVVIRGDRQWEQEKAGRFGPLDRDLDRRFEAAGSPTTIVEDPCLGTITLQRTR
jgi:4-amino-4-deoxy-L-arabinose transferase-like glycosyltransferase